MRVSSLVLAPPVYCLTFRLVDGAYYVMYAEPMHDTYQKPTHTYALDHRRVKSRMNTALKCHNSAQPRELCNTVQYAMRSYLMIGIDESGDRQEHFMVYRDRLGVISRDESPTTLTIRKMSPHSASSYQLGQGASCSGARNASLGQPKNSLMEIKIRRQSDPTSFYNFFGQRQRGTCGAYTEVRGCSKTEHQVM